MIKPKIPNCEVHGQVTLDVRSATSLGPQILKPIHSSIRAQLEKPCSWGHSPPHGVSGVPGGEAIPVHGSDAHCLTSASSVLTGLSGSPQGTASVRERRPVSRNASSPSEEGH